MNDKKLISFIFLAYLLTWVPLTLLALSLNGILAIKLSEDWHAIGAFGPALAALIVIGKSSTNEKQAFRDRLTKLKIGWREILLATVPLLLFVFAVVFNSVFIKADFSIVDYLKNNDLTNLGSVIIWILPFFLYGIFEEIGWRGYLLPKLQQKYTVLKATFLLWGIWALWHLPMFFYRFDFDMFLAIGFVFGMYLGALILTYTFNATGGSVIATIIWHILYNFANAFNNDTISMLMTIPMIFYAVYILLSQKGKRFSP